MIGFRNFGRAVAAPAMAVALTLAMAGCGGGAPSELEVKGLRLGMPIEDAARAMLENGLPPGDAVIGEDGWPEGTFDYPNDIFSHSQTGVREEYRLAKRAHDIAWFEAAVADGRVPDLRSFFESQSGGRLSYADQDMIERFSVEDVPAFVDGWYDTHGSSALLPKEERFEKLREFVASRYPDGPRYEHGGPWDGESDLVFDEHGNLTGPGWSIAPDEEGKVKIVVFATAANNALFNAADYSAEEFAASFADAYGLPGMEFYAKDVNSAIAEVSGEYFTTGWAYLDRDNGWAVNITERKVLTLMRVAPASEAAFD